jgi:hypothetical protein
MRRTTGVVTPATSALPPGLPPRLVSSSTSTGAGATLLTGPNTTCPRLGGRAGARFRPLLSGRPHPHRA